MSRQILTAAITLWGEAAQVEMLQEEATELALAARKHVRENSIDSLNHLAEEIADVTIMIEQMTLIYENLSKDVAICRAMKLARLERRIAEKNFNLK
ncbi:hypothetical protein [Sphingobacterium sp. LRF_L2]|uniref:hypothetical protein n=1 Tax=Sphingobacterium sp. LRF_L2 TaxID=3369421 RepID=UPI003F603C02